MAAQGPRLAVDVIVELSPESIVLIKRKYPPYGWAIPGGIVEAGESTEAAARREIREETGLEIELLDILGVYSAPDRDPRGHTVSIVYTATATSARVQAGDDAAEVRCFAERELPTPLAFDHGKILFDYFQFRRTGQRPRVASPSDGGYSPRWRGSLETRLSEEERRLLLRHARLSLSHAVRKEPLPDLAQPPKRLMEAGAAFVTLKRGNELRGCVGVLSATKPLVDTVGEMAVSAALNDPRFPPVAASELDDLTIEISVLSSPRPIRPEQIEVGVHGLVLVRGLNRGVLLPQVATENAWDRETFLAHTCLKAGLPEDAWRDPQTSILAFTAEVFGEKEKKDTE